MYRLIASLTSPNSIIVLCRKPAFVGSTIVLGNFTAILTLHPLIVSTLCSRQQGLVTTKAFGLHLRNATHKMGTEPPKQRLESRHHL